LEIRLESESFEPLISFLAFLVQKLWPKNNVHYPQKKKNPKLKKNFPHCKLEDSPSLWGFG